MRVCMYVCMCLPAVCMYSFNGIESTRARIQSKLECILTRVFSPHGFVHRHRLWSHRLCSHRFCSHRFCSHRFCSHRLCSHAYVIRVRVRVFIFIFIFFTVKIKINLSENRTQEHIASLWWSE